MPILQTVRVKRDGPRGHHIINASDYDPKVHVLVDENGKSLGKAEKSLADLTNPELIKLAKDEGIDLGDATKKADLIAAIELGREDAKDADDDGATDDETSEGDEANDGQG